MQLFRLLILSFSLFFFSTLNAQTLEWAKQITGFGEIFPRDIKLDNSGDILVSGHFTGTVNFDTSSTLSPITSNGGFDVFLAKYDSNGDLIWVRSFGGSEDDRSFSMAVGKSGSVTIVGTFRNVVDFNTTSGATFITSSKGGSDLFISKFNSNGDWIFTLPLGGRGDDDGREVRLDSSENIFVTGAFRETVNFNPLGSANNLTANSRDGFTLALTDLGGFRWVNSYELFTNQFFFPIDVNTQQELTRTTYDFSYFYIQKIANATGNIIWEKQIPRVFSSFIAVTNVITDQEDNIIVGGVFFRIADLDPSADSAILQSPNTSSPNAGFFAKYDSNGEILFAKGIYQHNPTNSYYPEILDLEIDSKNNIYMTGAISGITDFDPSDDSAFVVPKGSVDIIDAVYGPQGELIAVNRTGEASREAGLALTLDENNNIYSTGYFSQVVDFDPDPNRLLYFTAPSVEEDGYFRKQRFPCLPAFSYDTIRECNGFRLPNGELVLQNGDYKDTLIARSGCDSILAFNVTIIPVDTSVTIFGRQYISNANSPNTFYQWVDCNDQFASIPMATGRTYEPVNEVGAYAVVVLENNCRDTSRCYGAAVGIEDQLLSSKVSISPNPTQGVVSIDLGDFYEEVTVEVTNMTGQLVNEKHFSTIDEFQLELVGTKGVYVLTIRTDRGEMATIRVVKE